MLLGTTTIIVVVGGCKSIIPIFKEVTPEKNGWNKKGGNFLISRERGSTLFSSKVCAITRECEHIRPQFSGPKAFVDLTTQPATYPHLLFKEADYSDLKTKYICNYFVIWAPKWSCTASSLLTRILCPRRDLLKFRGKCLKQTIEETNFSAIFFIIGLLYSVGIQENL